MRVPEKHQTHSESRFHFFVGTKAQFIKMAPVMHEFERRGQPYRYVDSGQHSEFTATLRQVLSVREPDICLHSEGDIQTISSAMGWYLRLTARSLVDRRWLREKVFPGGGLCLVHGDTLSTLLGLKLARRAGLTVAHIEAGLRSFKYLAPFPEELIRIACMRRSDLLFTPSVEATRNLETMRIKGEIVQLPGNTVIDALDLALQKEPSNLTVPPQPYVLATCHRLETIRAKNRLQKVVQLLNRVSEQVPVLFVRHNPTRLQMERFGLSDDLSTGVTTYDMQDYVSFAHLLVGARMVLTDGGSIQEECAALHKPCLILRNRTERTDGLDSTATLWAFDPQVAEKFMTETVGFSHNKKIGNLSPSECLVDALLTALKSDTHCEALSE